MTEALVDHNHCAHGLDLPIHPEDLSSAIVPDDMSADESGRCH
jgi:hypothetical protein